MTIVELFSGYYVVNYSRGVWTHLVWFERIPRVQLVKSMFFGFLITYILITFQIAAEYSGEAQQAGLCGCVGRVRGRGTGVSGAQRRGASVRGRHLLVGGCWRAATAWRRVPHCALQSAATGIGMILCLLYFLILL